MIVYELDQATGDGVETVKETNKNVAVNININVGINSLNKDTEGENADVVAKSTQETISVHSVEKCLKEKGAWDSLSETMLK